MSDTVRLRAGDGHEVEAYVAQPGGEPIAGRGSASPSGGIKKTPAPAGHL